jgi:hypothetical protein
MHRKPHIVRLSDGWWCAGYDGDTPWLAYSKWFLATGMSYLGIIKWEGGFDGKVMIGIEE